LSALCPYLFKVVENTADSDDPQRAMAASVNALVFGVT
jgi:hypothetical protein